MASTAEGHLEITLRTGGEEVRQILIVNRRPLEASRLLLGRSPAEALELVPRLFSLCGTAQQLAGLAALENAAGIVPTVGQLASRGSMLAAETAREQAMRIFIDWPRLIGEAPDAAILKPLRASIAAHDRQRAVELLAEGLKGQPLADPEGWAEKGGSAPARLLRKVLERGLSGFGASAITPLPPLEMGELAERLDKEPDYPACPDWRGAIHETGPLTRHPGKDNGLLARLLAQLAELDSALAALAPPENGIALPPPALVSGRGIAGIEAARGRLVHRVRVEDGRVAAWRILAPTEWNFHPRGAFACGLTGAKVDGDLAWKAEMLAVAIDPCVAVKIRVE